MMSESLYERSERAFYSVAQTHLSEYVGRDVELYPEERGGCSEIECMGVEVWGDA